MSDKALRRLRERAKVAVGQDSLREVAQRVGISHFALWKFLKGRDVRASTIAAIQSWLERPDGENVVRQLRNSLRRALGRLPRKAALDVEDELRKAIEKRFKAADEAIPAWVTQLGRRGRGVRS